MTEIPLRAKRADEEQAVLPAPDRHPRQDPRSSAQARPDRGSASADSSWQDYDNEIQAIAPEPPHRRRLDLPENVTRRAEAPQAEEESELFGALLEGMGRMTVTMRMDSGGRWRIQRHSSTLRWF